MTQSALPVPNGASILGFPPITSTSSSPVAAPATVQALTTISGNPMTLLSTMSASTTSSRPSQHPNQATQEASAIGAGIGVPLGVAAIGLLGLLFWREKKRRIMNKHQSLSSDNDVAQGGRPFSNQATPRKKSEFPDSQIPWELDHGSGIVEMPALLSSRA